MVAVFVNLINHKIYTIGQVPLLWRDQVEAVLSKQKGVPNNE